MINNCYLLNYNSVPWLHWPYFKCHVGLVATIHISGGKNISDREIITTVNLEWEVRPGIFQEHQEGRCDSGKEEEEVKLERLQ